MHNKLYWIAIYNCIKEKTYELERQYKLLQQLFENSLLIKSIPFLALGVKSYF